VKIDSPKHTRIARCQFCVARVARVASRQRAFSLLELLVVIAVVTVLTALIMPAMRHVYENANRVVCAAQLQQIGQAMFMYASDHKDRLPYSAVLHHDAFPPNLMAAKRAGAPGNWDGLGLLYSQGYCAAPACYYCPSHRGEHSYDRYAHLWFDPNSSGEIFTNYHYAGDIEWTSNRRRTLDDGHALVLATDGLRTFSDFNHYEGTNMLRGDGAVRWRNNTYELRERLPETLPVMLEQTYLSLWDLLSEKQ
jgi:prepilin-type N-terminal cleavage/methylation domain-containing protein